MQADLVLALILATDARTSTLDSSAFKALLSIAVVAAAALIALILAKIASYFYDRKIARKKEPQPADAEAADLVRARLAVMQFKRYRTGQAELTPEQESMRKTIGIWSYKGGTTVGPLKPPRKRSEVPANTDQNINASRYGTEFKRERKVAEKADVSSSSPRISGAEGAALQLASSEQSKQSQKENNSDAKVPHLGVKEAEKSQAKNSAKPINQGQLVSEVNKNVPVKPHPGLALKLNQSGHNKVGTLPLNGPQAASKEQPSMPGTSRDLNSQSSSHETGDSTSHTPSAPSSPGKGPSSSRRLFTVVTPSVEKSKALKRRESEISPKTAGKRTSDTQSMKSEPGMRDAEHSEGDTVHAPPPKRPTTSHMSSRGPPLKKSTSSVGVTILSSNAGKQAANGKSPAPTVKVKPNTGVGVAKDDSSNTSVALAGSKG